MIAATPQAVLEQALAWDAAGEAVVLVTLTGIEGSASRALGTQMAVTATGLHIGSFSGGCIDHAIVGEAQAALARGKGHTVRFGLGSPYIDIRLPCGGGIDLLFTPRPSAEVMTNALAALHRRSAITLYAAPDSLSPSGPGFALNLFPALRITAFGQGDDLAAFLWLARTFGAQIQGFTPRADDAARLREQGLAVDTLADLRRPPVVPGDAWTAFAFLFHDRDWEDALLPPVLQLPGFYHGAVGSQRTHAARLERLRAAGTAEATLARLRGHVGLIPATRDPATLAVSILAEIAADYAAISQPVTDG